MTRTIGLFALIGLRLVFTTCDSNADEIVNWDGNYVSASLDFQGINSYFLGGVDADGDSAADDSIGGRLFDWDTAMNPTSGYSGTSGTFYGGKMTAHQNDVTTAAFDDAGIQNHGPNDDMHFHISQGRHFHDAHVALMWKQANFLNGGSPYYFTSLSNATLTMGQSPNEATVGAQARLMVQDDNGDFWLSQTAFTSPGTGDSFTWDGFTSGSDGMWAQFDPFAAFPGGGAAGSDLRFDQDNATFVDKKFGSIVAVGFHFEQDTFHNNLDFHFGSFTVDGMTIPEPSTAGLLGILFAGMFLRRRRS